MRVYNYIKDGKTDIHKWEEIPTLSYCLSLFNRMMTNFGCIWKPSSLNERLRPSNVTFMRYLKRNRGTVTQGTFGGYQHKCVNTRVPRCQHFTRLHCMPIGLWALLYTSTHTFMMQESRFVARGRSKLYSQYKMWIWQPPGHETIIIPF